jgi:hypothetical protein
MLFISMTDYKTCTKCCQEKPIDDFSRDKHRKDGRYPHCSACQKAKITRWTAQNKEWISEYHADYYTTNKQRVREYKIANREHFAGYMRQWRKDNAARIKSYKLQYHTDVESKQIEYRMLYSLRGRLRQALNGAMKSQHTMELVGCNMAQLKEHLSSKFKDGMTWNNYGQKGWHIDHIIPCASFNMTDPTEQKKCFHYTNLQPLWWLDNCRKNKY